MPYNLFWHLNPKKLEPFKIAYNNELKQRDWERWQLGMYIKSAYASFWNDKNKYPDKPFMSDAIKNDDTDHIEYDEDGNEVLTEKQKEQTLERIAMQMAILEGRNRRAKKRKEREQKRIAEQQTEG